MKRLPKVAWMMNAVVLGMWGASQLRAAGAQTPDAPLASGGRLTPHSGGTIGNNAGVSATYSIKFTDTDVTGIFKVLSESSHTRIIVSDDVHARLPYINMADASVFTILQRIAAMAHLAVGKVGTDTYLIVNAPVVAERVPLSTSPFSTPFPPYLPRVEPAPMPGSQAKPDPHRGWSPRTFNGMAYYMIPLTQSATATTAPALKSLRVEPAAPPTSLKSGAITPAK